MLCVIITAHKIFHTETQGKIGVKHKYMRPEENGKYTF